MIHSNTRATRFLWIAFFSLQSALAGVPYIFSAGNPISASQMNANFSYLASITGHVNIYAWGGGGGGGYQGGWGSAVGSICQEWCRLLTT